MICVMLKEYRISELSQEFDVTPRTLRFYEEKGMLRPRRSGQNRFYSSADYTRLRLILRGKRLGFSLAESQQLIEMYEPDSSNVAQLQAVLDKIAEKRTHLQQQLEDLTTMQSDLDEWETRYQAALAKLSN